MRVNVYQEELTKRIEPVTVEVNGRRLYGIRFYLKSHPDMHPPIHPDDDSSAVTFWHIDPVKLANYFYMAATQLPADIVFPDGNQPSFISKKPVFVKEE